MAWSGWGRKPTVVASAAVGLDVNAGWVRAMSRLPADGRPRPIALADEADELPLILGLESRTPSIGWPAYRQYRLQPLSVCRNFLPAIGTSRCWRGARATIDAAGALAAAAAVLRQRLPAGHAAGIAFPSYLTDAQIVRTIAAIESAGVHVAGSMTAPLALAATAPLHGGSAAGVWNGGTAIVLDADEHALTWAVLGTDGSAVRQLATHATPAAGVSHWFDRLIGGIADRCVKICRRDPRDSAMAEQGLFEQLDALLVPPPLPPTLTLQIRTSQWYQEMKLNGDDLESLCAPLARTAIEGLRQALAAAHAATPAMAPPELLWVTAGAARLPGLVAAAGQHMPESTSVRPLPADAIASATIVLAERWLAGELTRGHYADAAPRLMAPRSPEMGRPPSTAGRRNAP